MSNDSEHTPPAIPSAAGDPVEDSENTGLGLRAGDAHPMHSSAPHSGPEEPPSESWVRPVVDRGLADSPLDPLAEASLSSRHSYPRESDETSSPPPVVRRARRIPNLGHTLLLLILTAVTLLVTEFAIFSIVMATHLFGNEAAQQLLREPRLLIPCMAISYFVIVALAWPIFSTLWREPFLRGVHWNSAIVARRSYLFIAIGIVLSIAVQLLSNYLPIPKTLPIDDFFRTPADLWLVAIFGTFVAPVCEELAFRGFLLPSLASAWDWLAQRRNGPGPGGLGRNLFLWSQAMRPSGGWEPPAPPGASPDLDSSSNRDPKWSANAIVFSSILTSIGFALLHADQLAHSWAPLGVLFAVSLVLCAVRLRAHSLAASALVHAAYNGAIFALIFFATDGFRHLDKLTR
jgi:hypothetical protein